MKNLNPLQMRRAVRDYRYEVGEGRMTEECNQYLAQLQKDWERRRVKLGVELARKEVRGIFGARNCAKLIKYSEKLNEGIVRTVMKRSTGINPSPKHTEIAKGRQINWGLIYSSTEIDPRAIGSPLVLQRRWGSLWIVAL